MRWIVCGRADPDVAAMADRHYSRKSVGARFFTPPGRALVLKTEEKDAMWITTWQHPLYTQHAWPGAWMCSMFRNEGPHLSSDLIREAVAATLYKFGAPPHNGMITFVNPDKVRKKRDPGRCFVRAGFRRVGTVAKGALIVLQLLPEDMPPPMKPRGCFGWHRDLFGFEVWA